MSNEIFWIDEIGDEENRKWVSKYLHNSIKYCKRRAKKKKIEFNLTHEYIDHLLFINPDRCSISGIKFRATQKSHLNNPYSPSIDRITSDAGYVEGNIRIVARCINFAMNTWGEETLKETVRLYNDWNTTI